MRTLFVWLLPLYNLFSAVAFLRHTVFRSPEDLALEGYVNRQRNPALVVFAWVLVASCLASFALIGNARFFAVPFVVFAAVTVSDRFLRGRRVRSREIPASPSPTDQPATADAAQ